MQKGDERKENINRECFFISLALNSQSSNDIKKQNSRQCGELKFRSQE